MAHAKPVRTKNLDVMWQFLRFFTVNSRTPSRQRHHCSGAFFRTSTYYSAGIGSRRDAVSQKITASQRHC